MDAFQTASSIIALVELCVKAAKFIRDAKKTAGAVIEELDSIDSEIQSLQNVSKLINEILLDFQSLDSQVPPNYKQLLKELDANILVVVRECEGHIKKLQTITPDIRAPIASGFHGRLDSINAIRRNNSRKDEIQRCRENIKSGQNRLQAFYISLNIIQVQVTAASVKGVSDRVRKLGFELKSQIAQIGQHDESAGSSWPGQLPSVATLLGSVKFNKHFDVPRFVGAFFTGRQNLLQELKEAFDELRSGVSGLPKVFVIHGFPGSGKTDFSFKFAEQYRESFWGVFHIQADSHDLMDNSFKRIVQYADRKVEPDVSAAKHWLASQQLPWLLIMDNADDTELDLRRYFPANSSGCILITTRHRDFRIHGNVGVRSFSFERLQHDEAKTVLLRAANEAIPARPKIDIAASRISEELQCLPLALVSAGKTIRHKLCGWKDYLIWYRKNCELISRRLQTGSVMKEVEVANLTVIPILEPHFSQLERSNDKASIDALDLVHTLGYFHHRNISFRLLKLVAKNANKTFVTPGDDDDRETDVSNISKVSQALKSKALETLEYMVSSRIALPDVLRNTTSDKLDEHRLRAALSKLEDLNLIRCDDAGNDGSHLGQGIRRKSRQNSTSDDESGSDFGDNQYTYSLHPLVHSWVRQRHSRLSIRSMWCEAANNALAQCIVLEIKAFTGDATYASPHFDARELLPHINHARSCKAELDKQLKDKALEAGWLRSSLFFFRVTPTSPPLLTKIHNAVKFVKYSLVYHLCGDFQKAADLQSEVRSFVVSRRGMDNRISIYMTLALASTMRLMSEFGKATDLQKEAVEACRKVFGPKHPQTLAMIDQYGLLLFYHGRLRECTMSHQEAFDGFVVLGSKYRRQALIAHAHLGAVRARYMEFTQSRDICQQAVSGLEELDPEDEEILWAKEALAHAHGELGNGARAYELMCEVYSKRELALGKQHPFTLWAAVNKSRALWKMTHYEDALTVLAEAREIAEITLPKHHFGYLAGEVLRACIIRDQGHYEEAQLLFLAIDNTHEEIKQKKGTDHADRIVALGYRLELFEMQDKYEEAITIGQRILEALRQINREGLGWQHPMRQRVSDKIIELEELRHAEIAQAQALLTPRDGLRQRTTPQGVRMDTSPDQQGRRTLMRFHSDDSTEQTN